MPLEVTRAATETVYTTTSYVKSLLGTTSTANDATLSAIITAASRWADGYVGYPLGLALYRETVPTYGRRRLMLGRTPVRSISALYFGTSTEDEDVQQLLTSEFRVESREAGFLSRDEGWEWTVPAELELTVRPAPGQEYQPWLIDYAAGYTYDGLTTDSPFWSTAAGTTSTGRTLPEDIEHAVALRAVSMWQGVNSAKGDVRREKLGDLEVERQNWSQAEGGGRLTAEEMLLGPYQRVV